MQDNLTTTIHKEALKITTDRLMGQLSRRIQYIEAQYNTEIEDAETLKRLQHNEEFIRDILSCLTDYDSTIEAISKENQQLRSLYSGAATDAKFWHESYMQELKTHTEYMGIIADKFRQLKNSEPK